MPSITFREFYEEENNNKRIRIFLDMDGVLTDFEKSFKKLVAEDLSTEEYEEKYGSNPFWGIISEKGEEFWANMEWMADGKILWNYFKKYDPIILSAPSRDDTSKTGKVKWLEKNIPDLKNHYVQTKARRGGDKVSHVILNNMKYRYATGPEDILIDDKSKNIRAWEEAGGTGILHKSANDTIQKYELLLN